MFFSTWKLPNYEVDWKFFRHQGPTWTDVLERGDAVIMGRVRGRRPGGMRGRWNGLWVSFVDCPQRPIFYSLLEPSLVFRYFTKAPSRRYFFGIRRVRKAGASVFVCFPLFLLPLHLSCMPGAYYRENLAYPAWKLLVYTVRPSTIQQFVAAWESAQIIVDIYLLSTSVRGLSFFFLCSFMVFEVVEFDWITFGVFLSALN
jgi:hypothetical protein